MAERGQDPTLRQENRELGFRFVFRATNPCRDHYGAVVCGHLFVGPVDPGLITTGARDSALEVIRNEDRAAASEEAKHALMCADPAPEILTPSGFGVGVSARAECPNEQLDSCDLAGLGIDDLGLETRDIDEGLFAGSVDLPHGGSLDRLLHNSYVLDIKGRSYRLRDLERAVAQKV